VRIDWRRVLVVELAILAGCVLVFIAWLVLQRVLHTALLLLIALVLAFALGPLVDRAEARTGRRGVAAAIVYLALLLVVVVGLVLLTHPFVSQATALLSDLPHYVEAAKEQAPGLDSRLRQSGIPLSVADLQAKASGLLVESSSLVLGSTIAVLAGLTGLVVDLVLVLVMSLYLVLDGPRIRAALAGLVPPERRESARFVEDTITRVAGGYLRGQLLMAVTIGALAGLGAVLFRLNYPVVIGVVAGIMELIPMFGPILGAIPALLLALLNPFPTVVWVALYFIAIQQVESNVLGPRITGHAVGLHPLGAMLALLAGFEVAGILGALFAVPVVGIVWVLIAAVYRRVRYGIEEPPPARPTWRIAPWLMNRAPARPSPAPDNAETPPTRNPPPAALRDSSERRPVHHRGAEDTEATRRG
jgi:predicted PurR-regulated permease PerM